MRRARNRRGSAALELALGAPFLVLLLAGGADVINYYLAQQRIESASALLAQIITQCNTVTNADVNDFANFAQMAVGGRVNIRSTTSGSMIISAISLTNNAANSARVRWQYRTGVANQVSSFGTVNNAPALSGNMTLVANQTYFGVEIMGTTQVFVLSPRIMNSFIGPLRGVTLMVSRAANVVPLQTAPSGTSRNCTA